MVESNISDKFCMICQYLLYVLIFAERWISFGKKKFVGRKPSMKFKKTGAKIGLFTLLHTLTPRLSSLNENKIERQYLIT